MPKPKIIIDPGHGGADTGAVYGNYLEKELVLDISLNMAEELRIYGYPVTLTRVADTTLTPNQRTNMVKESSGAICISNHINAGRGEGAEVIYSIHDEKHLAKLILEELVLAGMNNRRIYTRQSNSNPDRDYYYMHRNTRPVETVIVEYGFIDNINDRAKLIRPEFRKKLAKAATRGIIKYLAVSLPNNKIEQKVIIIDSKGHHQEFPKEKINVIQGYTYLEGRELTKILGGQVKWDAAVKTAIFDFSKIT